jgi:REP element-mobilizing transposase RayT
MAVKTSHNTFDRTWFVTFTCYKWIPIFELTDSYDLVYNWLSLLKRKGLAETLAFVIMPNHVHLLVHLISENRHLNPMIGNAKRFMAYEIIKRLKEKGLSKLLHTLAEACSEKEKAKGQRHKVFEPSFDAKPIYTDDFFYQKLSYIHSNPVTGKWNLCSDFTVYPHSSAAFYEMNMKHPSIDIRDFRMVEERD